MSEKKIPALEISPNEYGDPLTPGLRRRLEQEWQEAQAEEFPSNHPYDDALRRTLDANVMTLNCEKIIARHCFHKCAEKIRELGPPGRHDAQYQKYISLLRTLPTDWFDDQNGSLLDQIDLWN
ncbi:MAG: hypothetical protein ACOH5I_10805 [Oligoflexus sp.]